MTILVTGQNLNQLRQKHLRGVRALQTPAGSSIYRKVTIISPPKNLVPRFRVILGSTQGYARVTEKFLVCCALRGHFEDMMLGTCYFSCRVRLALRVTFRDRARHVAHAKRTHPRLTLCDDVACDSGYQAPRKEHTAPNFCAHDRLTNDHRRN